MLQNDSLTRSVATVVCSKCSKVVNLKVSIATLTKRADKTFLFTSCLSRSTGASVAEKNMFATLATLLHCYTWLKLRCCNG